LRDAAADAAAAVTVTWRTTTMAKESIILELNTETDWDGVSPTTLSRDDAVVTGQRYYKFNVVGPHGVIASDLGGLFSPVSAKLIGIASSSWNPESKARVIASDANGSFRQEITLKPTVQHLMFYPGDKLALLTKDGGRGQIALSVNEMSEADSVQWGLQHECYSMPTRFRIVRETGTAFAPNLPTTWQPAFTYDPITGLMVSIDNGTGVIPSYALTLYPRFQGGYVSVRYAGHSGDGKLHVVDNPTRKSWVAESSMTDVKWSSVQFISHDDGIALEATPAVAGQRLVCDIEVALVHPSNRLAGRFAEGK
jgi:hypothetical protein